MAAAGIAAALFTYIARPTVAAEPAETRPDNPLDLKTAIQFALILAPIMLLTRALKEWSGDMGLYLLAAASGLVDIDAIALSLATMTTKAETLPSVATAAILLASAVNTLVKPAIAVAVAGPRTGLRLLLPLAIAAAIIAGGIMASL
jgi:uncharacterized membrane protein (DUF4010 family)